MKRSGWIFPIVLFLGIAAWPVLSEGGVVMIDRDGSTTYISNGKFKEVSGEEMQTMVFDSEGGFLTIIDSEEKTYARGSVAEFCAAVSGAMGAAMEGMTEEEKAMMKQFMSAEKKKGNVPPPEVAVVMEGSGGKIAGLDTTKYTVRVDGDVFEEVWLTEDGRIMKEFRSIAKLAAMTSQMAGCALGELGVDASESPYTSPGYRELMKKGYPVKVLSYDEGSAAEEDEVVEVKILSIPPSEFEPPDGYRKVSFGELMR